jgi:hypothetical protein
VWFGGYHTRPGARRACTAGEWLDIERELLTLAQSGATNPLHNRRGLALPFASALLTRPLPFLLLWIPVPSCAGGNGRVTRVEDW